MARTRRKWSALLPFIRRILREQDVSFSEWSDADLLDGWNASLDLRSIQLDERREGWNIDAFETDIVAGQHLYTKPEGAERIHKISMLSADGRALLPLLRDERIGRTTLIVPSTVPGYDSQVPRWRLRGEFILIEPPFSEDKEDGLVIEADSAPAFFSGSADARLSLRFPVRMETLLVYDTVAYALGIEDQLGNTSTDDPQRKSRFQLLHAEYENWWMEYIAESSSDPVYSRPGNWGA